jgi:hypothetical protein
MYKDYPMNCYLVLLVASALGLLRVLTSSTI